MPADLEPASDLARLTDLNLWLWLVVTGALWLALHLRALARVWRVRDWPGLRWLALWLPPVLPWLAWQAGARVLSVAWLVVGLGYAWLWTGPL